MLDIEKIDHAVGKSSVTVMDHRGNPTEIFLSFRRPDHLEIVDIEYRTAKFSDLLAEYNKKRRDWESRFKEENGHTPAEIVKDPDLDPVDFDYTGRPKLEVPAELFLPRVEFCREYITEAEGISKPWGELTREQQIKILRMGGPYVIWKLYGEIVGSAKIPEERKND